MAEIGATQWIALSPLLDELLEAQGQTRVQRLAQIRRDDAALAEQLEMLLRQRTAMERDSFMEGIAFPMAGEPSLVGQTIGAYTLSAPIGQGGMGSVWRADRSDGRYQATVAVKFLNLALLGRGGAERFAREGSMLARLTHPNIARLFDAGVANGQPYLVLEYIEGLPIDRYCDSKALPIEPRLRLFLDVLAAVAHAHTNLILHRDLKPSNILVTAQGQVKLLDFGIGKLLAEQNTAASATELTHLAGHAFTPDYAAPEQVQGTDVTTATDVYALGVLLYQLLAGRHPTALLTQTAVDRVRAVIEKEPAPVSDAAAKADETTVQARAATAPKLARALRGDLDNIVAKALKKQAAERFPTVAALAEDLRRYLDHEPVSARADSLAYRASKFVRRYWLAVGAASAMLLVLLAGVVGITWQAIEAQKQRDVAVVEAERADRERHRAESERTRAERERTRAEDERARAERAGDLATLEAHRAREQAVRADGNARRAVVAQTLAEQEATRADAQAKQTRLEADKANAVQSFLVDIFRTSAANQPDPAKARQTTARELLDIGTKRIDTALADAPTAKLEVMATLEDIYRRSLLMHDEATQLARARLALAKQVYGNSSVEVASVLLELAGALHRTRAEGEREALLTEAQRILDDRGDVTSRRRALLWHEWSRYYQTRDPNRAAEYAGRAVGVLRQLGDAKFLGEVLFAWGTALAGAQRYGEAEPRYREVVEMDSAAVSRPTATLARMYLASTQYRLLKMDQAEQNFRVALEGTVRQFEPDHARVLEVKRRYALFLQAIGRFPEAIALSREAAEGLSTAKGSGDALYRVYFPTTLAAVTIGSGQLQEGATLMAASVEMQRSSSTDRLYLATCLVALSDTQRDLGRYSEALRLLDEAGAIYRERKLGDDSHFVRALVLIRARTLAMAGRRDEAAALYNRVSVHSVDGGIDGLEDLRDLLENAAVATEVGFPERALSQATRARRFIQDGGLSRYLRVELGTASFLEGRLRFIAGDTARARELLELSVRERAAVLDSTSPDIADAQIWLARVLVATNERGLAQRLLSLAQAIHSRYPELGYHYRRPLRELEDRMATAP